MPSSTADPARAPSRVYLVGMYIRQEACFMTDWLQEEGSAQAEDGLEAVSGLLSVEHAVWCGCV